VNGVYSASSADRLAAAGIKLVNKVELFNLPSVGGTLAYDKPEGLTLRDDGAVIINYDNDFGTEGASGNAFTVVTFSNPAVDTEDTANGGYTPATNHDVYGLVMPDGLATFNYNGENFILAAGEGDDRNDFLNPDETARVSELLTAAGINATPAQKAGLVGTNAQRLSIFTNTGDLDRDGIVDQAYAPGSRSLRIFDSKGNVVWDSGAALEALANARGLYALNDREDAKGVEPEMVEVVRIDGRTYAFVSLERTTTSMAAIYEVTNPYAPVLLDPLVFTGATRVEGITFLTSDVANAPSSVIASSEGNDVVSVANFPIAVFDVKIGTIGADDSLTSPTLIQQGFDGKNDVVFTGAGNDSVDIEVIGGSDNKIFTGSGVDTIYAGSRDVITGGSSNDEIWAVGGDNNRLSGGSGDDDFIIGSTGNRALGGAGNDEFIILGGAGTNHLNGGAGSDIFRIVSELGDLPAAKQVVMDFTVGEDKIGLRGVQFADLSFSQSGTDAVLTYGNNTIGQFSNMTAAALNNQTNFTFG